MDMQVFLPVPFNSPTIGNSPVIILLEALFPVPIQHSVRHNSFNTNQMMGHTVSALMLPTLAGVKRSMHY